MNDNINPNHYLRFKITPAQFCIENDIPFAEGNVIKYICRWKYKGGLEDLNKAKRYIELLIQNEEGG